MKRTLFVAILAMMVAGHAASQIFFVKKQISFLITKFDAAACSGAPHDDNPAFAAFGAAARAGGGSSTETVLVLPTNGICNFPNPNTQTFWANGLSDLVVLGNNATLQGGNYVVSPINSAFFDDMAHSALFQTNNKGAKCVTLITSAQTSLFTVGSWVAANGVNLQYDSFPPNPGFSEYLQVASSGGGQVCFTTALKHAYKSTWPALYDPVDDIFTGPATLFALQPAWNGSVTWENVTFAATGAFGTARIFKLINVTFSPPSGQLCYTPTTSQYMLFQNVSAPNCAMQVDKQIGTLDFENSTFGNTVQFTVASSVNVVANNTSFAEIIGTPYSFVGANNTIGALPGDNSNFGAQFGAASVFNCAQCNLAAGFTAIGVGDVVDGPGNTVPYTFSGSTICYPSANAGSRTVSWMVPGANYTFWSNHPDQNVGVSFQITDLSISGPNVCAQTTLTSGLPTLPHNSGGNLLAQTVAVPQFSCAGCTGSPEAVALSTAPGAYPLFSYWSYTLSCTTIFAAPKLTTWGKLTSATYNVTVADSTQTTIKSNPENLNTATSGSSSLGTYAPVINLKTTGSRTVTGTSTSGGQSGDTLSAPGANVWLAGFDQPGISTGSDPSVDSPCLSITITVQTNQGIVNSSP